MLSSATLQSTMMMVYIIYIIILLYYIDSIIIVVMRVRTEKGNKVARRREGHARLFVERKAPTTACLQQIYRWTSSVNRTVESK